jgi:RNA 3'-terminal phosphate cyclase (ATP)
MRNESQSLVAIDGTHGEGGGALIRTALIMSALTEQSTRIHEVRGGTRYPGLDAEDVTLIRALADICNAETEGVEIASNSVTFHPTCRPKGFKGVIQSTRNPSKRGANSLIVLSSLLPVLARSGVYSSVTAEGETYGGNTLSYDYFANVTLPALKQTGLYAFPELVSPGFGRESNGVVELDVEPSALRGIDWTDRGSLKSANAVVATSSLPSTVGERITSHLSRLAQNAGVKLHIDQVDLEAPSRGVFVTAWARYERGMGGGTAMGSTSLRAENVAQTAFQELFTWMSGGGTTDPFLADQILLPLVLAEGSSTFTVSRLTQRFLSIVWVVKQFLPIHITVRGVENGQGIVTIQRG